MMTRDVFGPTALGETQVRPITEALACIAAYYAKPTPQSAYCQCVRVSERIVRALRRAGFEAVHVVAGRYWATADELTQGVYAELVALDPWQYKDDAGRFLVCHDWVEAHGYVIDGTSAQFNGPALRVVPVDDCRYDTRTASRLVGPGTKGASAP